MPIKPSTPSELKSFYEEYNPRGHFFDRDTMKFFGDTMRNFGLRETKIDGRMVYELFRKKPVKHGLHESAYFDAETFKIVYARKNNPDESPEARELFLFIENDGDLYRMQTVPIINNLAKKFAKGVYDHEAAKKLWKNLADNGAKKYTFEFDDRGTARYWQQVKGFGVFDPEVRREVAGLLADSYLENINGENPLIQPARASNPAPRIGAAKPRRKSQVTGEKPSMRLVRRREKNTRKGYYPNPIDSISGKESVPIYFVEQKIGKNWAIIGEFIADKPDAVKFARAVADKSGKPVRIETRYILGAK